MNRTILEEKFRQAEGHVARCEQNITQQRQIIAYLRREGLDAAGAERLLGMLELTQRLHITDRDRIEKELWST